VFESYWDLETSLRPVRFWKGSKAELLDQAAKMLAVFHAVPGGQGTGGKSHPLRRGGRRDCREGVFCQPGFYPVYALRKFLVRRLTAGALRG
jgi:hypothetical protein